MKTFKALTQKRQKKKKKKKRSAEESRGVKRKKTKFLKYTDKIPFKILKIRNSIRREESSGNQTILKTDFD